MTTVKIQFKCDEELLEKFDAVWKKKGYHTRTEALRELMRRLIDEY